MRTFQEIRADIHQATSINDAEALRALATEMQALGTPQAEAAASATLGNVYLHTGAYPEALEHYRRALAMHEELGARANAAGVTGNIANVYAETGAYPEALAYYRRAMAMYEELDDRTGVARSTGNIGTVYTDTGDYPQALEHHRRALAMYEELGDRAGAASATGNMGNVYGNTGDYPQALEHYRRALAMHEDSGDRAGAASVTGNMGIVYAFTGAYPEALEHFRRALTVHEELGNRAGATLTTGNMITTFMKLEGHDEAAALLERQAAMQLDDPGVRSRHQANRALLAEHRGDLDAAHAHLTEALATATEAGLRSAAAEYHEKLRDLAQRRNDFAGYIEHNNEYQRITEEIRGKQATQRLAVMEAERRVEAELRERDKERALLYGALPETVAKRMLRGEDVSGDHFEQASVLFLDIAGFTIISERIPAGHVVHLLKAIFKMCDDVCKEHGLTKIKTIGDSYLAVAGVPEPLADHAQRSAQAALAMLQGLNALELTMDPKLGDTSWTNDVGEITVRIGLHCGPLVAGIVGEERLQYDVWGDTVNVASRMESTGEPGRIQVSESFAQGLGARGEGREDTTADASLAPRPFTLALRGAIEVKGKGTMTTYWLEGA